MFRPPSVPICSLLLFLILPKRFLSLAEEATTRTKNTGFIPEGEEEYGEAFFNEHERIRPIYEELAQEMYNLLPRGKATSSILDVGCGTGYLVEAFRSETPLKSYCVEGSENAKSHWSTIFAPHYYQILDLKTDQAFENLPKTDVVTSFEVAEHLPPSYADHFVKLMVHHVPEMIFFGAATPNQDRGKNPSHVNENTFTYWIEKFRANGYIVDMPRTARYKHQLTVNPTYRQYFRTSWWYLKNTLVFVPASQQSSVDRALMAHPSNANMFNPVYFDLGRGMEDLWKRDWTEFATLFYQEQANAKTRLYSGDL